MNFQDAPHNDHTAIDTPMQFFPNQWFPAVVMFMNAVVSNQTIVSGRTEGQKIDDRKKIAVVNTQRSLAPLRVTFPDGIGRSGLSI